MTRKKIYYLIGFCLFSAGVFGQNFTSENCYRINNEKTFVHLENNVFVAGQQLSYKAYVVNAFTLEPTQRSKIIYFEIFGTGGKIMHWHQELTNGACSGTISLPDTLTGGIYTLKAYTNWMRNFSLAIYFTQHIFITRLGSDVKETTADVVFPSDSISVVPVNGGIIAGIENLFSYYINENMLFSDSAIIQVIDTSGVVIKSFLLRDRSLGKFSFIPDRGNIYYFDIVDGEDSMQIKIPEAKNPGYAIAIEELGDIISFKLMSDKVETGIRIPFDLFIYSGNQLVSEELFHFEKGNYSLQVLKNKFSKPIIDVVLQDPTGEILCRRLFALNPKNTVQLEITGIKETYGRSSDVSFQLKNGTTDTAILNLSVRISASNPFEYITDKNIQASFYYEPELGIQLTTKQAANFNLYLPHLIRNNSSLPKELPADTVCNFPVESDGYVLSGSVKDKNTHKPLLNQVVYLSAIDSVSLLDYAITNQNGQFYFLLNEENLKNKNILQLAGDTSVQNAGIDWKLDDKNAFVPISKRHNSYALNKNEQEFISEFKKIKLVELVYHPSIPVDTEVIQQKKQKKSFYFDPDYTIYPKDFYDLPDFREIAKNLIPTVSFKKKKDAYSVEIYDEDNHIIFSDGSLVLLNGIPFTDLNYIQTLGSDKIERIEVVNSRILYGRLSFNGILSIFTKDLEIPGSYLVKNSYIIQLANMVKSNINYSYNNSQKGSSRLPDFREVLYWNPDVVLQPGSGKEIHFRTSQLTGTYNINIQGIGSNGSPIYLNKTITIN